MPSLPLPPPSPGPLSGQLQRSRSPAALTNGSGLSQPPPTQQPSDWQRYVAAVRRHKWAVLLITVMGTGAGAVVTRMLDPQYSARAMLWIEAAARESDRGLISSEELVQAAGWVELVTSNAVLDSVVSRIRLYLRPRPPADSVAFADFRLLGTPRPGRYVLAVDRSDSRFRLEEEGGAVLQQGAVGDTVGGGLGFAWLPPLAGLRGRSVEFALITPHDAAQQLARSLRVRLDAGRSFVRIELHGPSPALAAATVNAVAERVVVIAAELKRQKFDELASILGGQHEHVLRQLRAAEAGLAAFRTRTAPLLAVRPFTTPGGRESGEGAAFTRQLDLRLSHEDVLRDRRAVEGILARVPMEGIPLAALSVIPSVRQSPQLALALDEITGKRAELRALRYRYTERSAPVLQLEAELDTLERRTVPELTRELAAELAAQAADLAQRVDSSLTDLRGVPALELEQSRLERDVRSAEELFTNVRQRYEAARLALISTIPDIRVLDRAVQVARPVSNFAPLLVALSLATSLGLAVIGVTVRDRADQTIRSPEQITQGMRLTILSAIPHVGWRALGRGDGPADEIIEALRGLRVRVLHAQGTGRSLLVTVTSFAPGDGKSFVSVNLALSFAYAGYRTLLIDGDVRRGVQHRVLEGSRRPGLTDVLAGGASVAEAARTTEYSNLTLLSSGTRMQRAPELLLSDRLRAVMAEFRAAHDVIVVDSPPLSVGVDPLLLATVTGNLLLVLRSGVTAMPLVLSKLEVLDSLPVHVIGAVLNDVRGDDGFRHYAYDVSGYALTDEESARGHGLPILGGRS
ncbi:MAG TPA: polysaccharide biosynthesis tyrosine autokinase [Gemmatimonadales bacterium]